MSQVLRRLVPGRHVGLVHHQSLVRRGIQCSSTLPQSSSSSSPRRRLHSTLLTMNGSSGPSAPGGPRTSSSRKRQYPFSNRNRNRRGPPHSNPTTAPSATQQAPSSSAPFSSTSSPSSASLATAAAAMAPAQTPEDGVPGRDRFDELARFHVHPELLATVLHDLKLTTMTSVQAQTLPYTLAGGEMLAQAKTGTGKTFAFLIPAIQKLVAGAGRTPQAVPARSRPVSLLVISPTRELAIQIAEDARRLLQRFPGYKVQIAVGGTNPRSGFNSIMAGCDILVATPGRILDYLGQEGGQMQAKLQGLQTFVLDEADRLMDMGFLPDIQKIVAYLPDKASTGRQGMLFSATINQRVEQFASIALSDGYKFISTIPKGEAQTHEHVPQRLITVQDFAHLTTAVLGALRHEMAAAGRGAFKAIVFAPTAAQVEFYSHVLGRFPDLPPVSEVHSRMTQSRRTKATDTYRKARCGVLVATDVIARGLDFPGVTNVFQVGLPSEKEAYIHRLGRTARAGAEGRGTLLVTSHEARFPRKTMSMIRFVDTPPELDDHASVMRITRDMDPEKQAKVYRAWLGYYKTHLKILDWTPAELVRQANVFALEGLGATSIPTVEKKLVGKMGLKGVPGLNIVKPPAPPPPSA